MHIEPGVVTGTKLVLSYVTATVSLGVAAKMAWHAVLKDGGFTAFCARTMLTTTLVFSFFQLLPHYPVGVSEVHFIFGSTLFLIFGSGPTAAGLVVGLLLQGLFFAPFDLPQYGMNITTLLIPLNAMGAVAKRIIAPQCAYKDVQYWQTLTLSSSYQVGIIGGVSFWALYGEGFSSATLVNITTFGMAYMSVIAIEPLVDLAILATVKSWGALSNSSLVQHRLFHQAI